MDVGGAILQPSLSAGRRFRRRQGGVCFESGPEREDSPGKMATAGSAERPGRPASPAAGRYRSGPASSSLENEAKMYSICMEGQSGGSPASPLCRAQRHPGSEERLRRRSDPERNTSRPDRRDCDSRKEFFVPPALIPKCPDVSALTWKNKCEDREELRRRNSVVYKEDEGPGVVSDSENEEPISWRVRNISAFIRKTKNSATSSGGSQRSQSCTDPVEDGGGKLKGVTQPGLMDRLGISHSYAAGILLSSENSRSVSAPITTPDRRLTWRAVVLSSAPLTLPLPRPERSISPESNDSISEELNHFKPIVCSPCTPPKRLPDGRVMEPTIVKSTPRNLTRGLQKATSYEASPAVLQKWRQIDLDRQSLKLNSKATLTSPVSELHNKIDRSEDGGGGGAKPHQSPAGRDTEGVMTGNKRRLLFEPLTADTDIFQKQSIKIRVPAIRYSSEATLRGTMDLESKFSTPESCSGPVLFSRKQSFSPYTRNSGFQSCKSVPKDSQSPRKESDSSLQNLSTSRRGKKREQKTKHLDADQDSDLKRSRSVSKEAFDEHYIHQLQQERQDQALALKLQRQFDLENLNSRSPNMYFLRSWMSSQNQKRLGLRRSRRINKKH